MGHPQKYLDETPGGTGDCTTVGGSESQRNSFYYARNDPVFTTSRAARVIHTHFEKESVVYQMWSLSFQCNRTEVRILVCIY